MIVHDLTVASSAITHPDTFADAYYHLLAEEKASDLERARELLGHDPDDY